MNRIVGLYASNVKRLTAVDIKPDRNTVIVGGKNRQGKSTLLDAILWALVGKKTISEKPVRTGESQAEIVVKIDNGLIVRRVINEDGTTTLEVKQDVDGIQSKVSSPQKLLDRLVGAIAFDPLEFTRLKPRDQVDLLKRVVGVNTDKIDAEIAARFEERKFENHKLRDAEGRLATMPKHADAPEEEQPAAELVSKIAEIAEENSRRAEIRRQAARAADKVKEATEGVDGSRQEVARIEAMLLEAKERLHKWEQHLQSVELAAKITAEKAEKVLNDVPDEPVREKLTQIEQLNQKARENAAYKATVAEVEAIRERVEAKTAELEHARRAKVAAMASATWPVKGLSFSESGVTYNDLPFEQCSSAEMLEISTAIGMSQNPKLRVMMIRDGSLLDDESLAAVEALAVKYDAQLWLEKVTNDPSQCSILISEGSVVGADLEIAEAESSNA